MIPNVNIRVCGADVIDEVIKITIIPGVSDASDSYYAYDLGHQEKDVK